MTREEDAEAREQNDKYKCKRSDPGQIWLEGTLVRQT